MDSLNSFAVFIPIVGMMSFAFVIASVLRYRSQRFTALANKDASGEAARHMELITSANDKLNGQVNKLEERIAVLERIATDPADRMAREIERLR